MMVKVCAANIAIELAIKPSEYNKLMHRFAKNLQKKLLPKGQIISKCPFGDFCPSPKKRSNRKNHGTLYH